jgi:translation initiation factor 6
MAVRCKFENSSNEIGVYSLLTNDYCILGYGGPENFYSIFDNELSEKMPIIKTTISSTKIVGSMIVGNKKGLLVPSLITDNEMNHLRKYLPEKIKIQKIDDRISALGNCISCNDSVAIIHPEFDKESEDIIADVLGVEVFKTTVANNPLVGTYSVFNNKGVIVHPSTTMEEYEELSKLIQVQIGAATVNRGSEILRSGCIVNDWIAFCGYESTSAEIDNIEKIFKISQDTKLMM